VAFTSTAATGWRSRCNRRRPSDSRLAWVILYVGPREPSHRQSDIWTILHDLFGVQNPPADHDRPPCCQGSTPEIDKEELEAFLRDLQQMTRGRVSSRRRRRST